MPDDYLSVDDERCDRCGGCVGVCAALALTLSFDGLAYDGERCTACGDCIPACPFGALRAS